MSADRVETYGGEEYVVRRVTGSASTKPYRCPGCHQVIRPGDAAHGGLAGAAVVVLLDATGLDERRHWHTPAGRPATAR